MSDIDAIRQRHSLIVRSRESAEKDVGILLAEVERLREALREIVAKCADPAFPDGALVVIAIAALTTDNPTEL